MAVHSTLSLCLLSRVPLKQGHGLFFFLRRTTGFKDREGRRLRHPHPLLQTFRPTLIVNLIGRFVIRSRAQITLARHLQHFHVISKRLPPLASYYCHRIGRSDGVAAFKLLDDGGDDACADG
ncbi:hypothetical protein, partial [Rhizobium tropici]|uniref:hypothetical protein n=1 Tax=Rhizobium tropici TaxID=398 RepID=UPI001AEDC3E2